MMMMTFFHSISLKEKKKNSLILFISFIFILISSCSFSSSTKISIPSSSSSSLSGLEMKNHPLIPPSTGQLSLNFIFTGKGCGSNDWCYDITNNTGTLTVNKVIYSAVAYYTQLWPGVLRWIDILGIAQDGSNLAIFYLDYWEGQVVSPLWEEDWFNTLSSTDITHAPAVFEDRSDDFFTFDVSLPQLNALPPIQFDSKVYISDSNQPASISLEGNTGWVVLEGTNYTTTPISFVNCDNCPKNCPECPDGPWYEVHMALSSPVDSCFGIYYIYPYDKTFVQLNYTLCLPSLTQPDFQFEADWHKQN